MTPTARTPEPPAKDRALRYVKTRILTGDLVGGELISEGDVAAALGMSRTPVREAFLRLEGEGLLRLYPKRGALVVPVSPEEIREVMEARLVLERFAIETIVAAGPESCQRVYQRMLDQLDVQRRAAENGDVPAFLDADRAFHAATVAATRNVILGGFYDSLRDRQTRMIGESTLRDPGRTSTILDEHRVIAEAIRDADRDAAMAAVAAHVASTGRALGVITVT